MKIKVEYLWLGTGNGLDKFDRETKQFTHYFNNSLGLYDFDYWISSIYEDTDRNDLVRYQVMD